MPQSISQEDIKLLRLLDCSFGIQYLIRVPGRPAGAAYLSFLQVGYLACSEEPGRSLRDLVSEAAKVGRIVSFYPDGQARNQCTEEYAGQVVGSRVLEAMIADARSRDAALVYVQTPPDTMLPFLDEHDFGFCGPDSSLAFKML